jgi:D-glycero-alpha-D-manno-heptose-7-phosphate kinase
MGSKKEGTVTLIRAKAPLRISFAGGGTDVPPYPENEGGCVLSATINKYAYGTLRPRADKQIRIESLDFGISISCETNRELVYDGKLDLVKAAIIEFGHGSGGFDLFLHSDVAPGSGLGASSTMMVALVGLLKEFRALPLTDYEIADLAYIIERKRLGIEGGLQDQYAATFGGFNYIEFYGDRVIVNPLKVSQDTMNELEHNLLLCYTGKTRFSARIISDQVSRYLERKESSLMALRELKKITIEMKNALLRRKLNEFGELLHFEWESKKRMSKKISNGRIDKMYNMARKSGAIGGKIAGAGGGGYMLLYCDFNKKHNVAKALMALGGSVSDISFTPFGLQTWRID